MTDIVKVIIKFNKIKTQKGGSEPDEFHTPSSASANNKSPSASAKKSPSASANKPPSASANKPPSALKRTSKVLTTLGSGAFTMLMWPIKSLLEMVGFWVVIAFVLSYLVWLLVDGVGAMVSKVYKDFTDLGGRLGNAIYDMRTDEEKELKRIEDKVAVETARAKLTELQEAKDKKEQAELNSLQALKKSALDKERKGLTETLSRTKASVNISKKRREIETGKVKHYKSELDTCKTLSEEKLCKKNRVLCLSSSFQQTALTSLLALQVSHHKIDCPTEQRLVDQSLNMFESSVTEYNRMITNLKHAEDIHDKEVLRINGMQAMLDAVHTSELTLQLGKKRINNDLTRGLVSNDYAMQMDSALGQLQMINADTFISDLNDNFKGLGFVSDNSKLKGSNQLSIGTVSTKKQKIEKMTSQIKKSYQSQSQSQRSQTPSRQQKHSKHRGGRRFVKKLVS